MKPIRIGPRERELVALHHPAAARPARRCALICPPYGQEAIRTHRLLKVLAERLARDGVDVLRFDYFGTGDSGGEDEAADLDGWTRDVATAADTLVRIAGSVPSVWIGLRLGATAALRAAAASESPPASMVVCDPILDGSDYLASLREAHDAAQAASYSLRAWQPAARADSDGSFDAIGFAMSRSMRAQLAALRPSDVPRPEAARLTLIRSPGSQAASAGLAGAAAATTLELAEGFDWTTEEAINASLVPMELLGALLRGAGGP